jgi:hypothetical protein
MAIAPDSFRAKRTQPGELRHRLAFDKRMEVNPDEPLDLGNTESVYVEQFVVSAKVQVRFGGESVLAMRLTGQQLVNVVVRQSPETEQIDTGWRARDILEDISYNIRSIVDPDDGKMYFEMLCQTGVSE